MFIYIFFLNSSYFHSLESAGVYIGISFYITFTSYAILYSFFIIIDCSIVCFVMSALSAKVGTMNEE